MSSIVVDIRHIKKCATCKYWYDPTNSAIEPQAPNIGLWKIKEVNQMNLCTKRNIKMQASVFCSADYICKL